MGKKRKATIPDFRAKPGPGEAPPRGESPPTATPVSRKKTVTPKTTSARSGHR